MRPPAACRRCGVTPSSGGATSLTALPRRWSRTNPPSGRPTRSSTPCTRSSAAASVGGWRKGPRCRRWSPTSSDGSPSTAANPTLARARSSSTWTPSPTGSESQLLHQIVLLGIAGFNRLGGPDFVRRDDLLRRWERWRIAWSPDMDAIGDRGGAVRLDARRGRRGPAARVGEAGRARRRHRRPAAARGRARRPRLRRWRAARPTRRQDPPGRRLPRRGRRPGSSAAPLPTRRDPRQPGARRRRVPAGRGVHARVCGSSRAWVRSPATTPS